ncbi:hypothetical protein AJ87_28665 [Rhizobium yanglingense]|nr:hypothetical protein AJ87_28665 [Rhizobium yanglingense]
MIGQIFAAGWRIQNCDAGRVCFGALVQVVDDQRQKALGRLLLGAVEKLVEFVLHHLDAEPDRGEPEDDHSTCERQNEPARDARFASHASASV